ncbi:SdiA-regulated domain-containing protein [Aliarcobacter vitoriensis]|uniref:SdiA-regulated domain-containing protein n=1 Tax=Aliarcobacter vitoriensis TaxID=2011099 RepID=UPI003AB01EE3
MKKILKANKNLLIFFSFLISTFVLVHYTDLDDKLLFKLFASETSIIPKSEYSYNLKEVKEVKKNLSGITYNDKTDTLFAITNSPRDIYEFDKEGNVLRIIDLKGFRDTEDLTYIKDDMFAILDEELSAFFIVNIDKDTKLIDKKHIIKEFYLDVRNFENFGLEGISYDNIDDIFYLVNERNPKKIVLIKGVMKNSPIEIKIKDKLLDNNTYLSDFSAIHFDEKTRHFYVLSDESSLLGRVEDKKDFSKYLDLMDNEISSKMVNPEGITKDSKGNIYIVGEPNLFLSIKRDEVLD